jgi:hypothetical protein
VNYGANSGALTKMRKSGVEKSLPISITPVLHLKEKHEMGVG